ncbi:MAG TPA: tetraacyldisaccharide 4'-kinase, partial [Candidatus Omnitrophica bacterium]|nr:tetraacyldisaccharide 4'-kinase [Candidatus Omnitrophota bacterium]
MFRYLYSLARDEKKGILACFFKAILLGLSFIYGFIVVFTRALYSLGVIKKAELESSVISVGNITR